MVSGIRKTTFRCFNLLSALGLLIVGNAVFRTSSVDVLKHAALYYSSSFNYTNITHAGNAVVSEAVINGTNEEDYQATLPSRPATNDKTMDNAVVAAFAALADDVTISNQPNASKLKANKHNLRKTKKHRLPSNMLFVTAPWEPEKLVASMKEFAPPNMQLRFYNDTQMARSVYDIGLELKQTYNISGVFDAWSLLRPWAFKADLWRALVLWKYGGVYVDNKIVLKQPLERWASLTDNETLSICFDHDNTFGLPNEDKRDNFTEFQSTWNAILSAKRESPVLLEIIQAIIHNVETRSRGVVHHALAVTGPILYGYAIATSNFTNTVRRPCVNRGGNGAQWLFVEGNSTTSSDANVITVTDEQEHGRTKTSGKNGYHRLYNTGRVYCDDGSDVTSWYGPGDHYACAIGKETLEAVNADEALF
ncbi:Capsular polysaccharide synthesis protein [Seminavis robusta]|uniref:Capsular polysaccharide synthesis protein n=1 Tax=Seminavis robusta TaxID=568900 RepID=A0A9N8H968_9STRA|nr:Capsular polysaccharide synthesis protein [Seminavis robusta]|eukprot:Sro181_g079020.1 Capsular polysaccharide synthesis protein (421) ;mRNA; r:27398-28734